MSLQRRRLGLSLPGMPPRFGGDLAALADVLAKHAPLPDFVVYSDNPGSPLQTNKALLHSALVQDLLKFHPPLVFPQSELESAMLLVADKLAGQWPRPLTDAERPDFKAKVARRRRVAPLDDAEATVLFPTVHCSMWK